MICYHGVGLFVGENWTLKPSQCGKGSAEGRRPSSEFFISLIMLCLYPVLLGKFPFDKVNSCTVSVLLIVAPDRNLWDITNSSGTECHTQVESAHEIDIPVSIFQGGFPPAVGLICG